MLTQMSNVVRHWKAELVPKGPTSGSGLSVATFRRAADERIESSQVADGGQGGKEGAEV